MNDQPGNLYAQREPRPSLTDEIEQGRQTATSAFGRGLRQQMQALRRRRKWLQRAALVVIVLYVVGLTVFIPMILLRKPAHSVAPPPPAAAIVKPAVPATLPAAPTKPTPVGVAATDPMAGRLTVQKLKSALEQLREARGWVQKNRPDTARLLLLKILNENPDNVEARWELAQLTFAQGTNDYTRELLLSILRADPGHKNAQEMLATTYLRLGHYESALALAQWILEGDADSCAAHRLAGLALLKTDRFEQAAIHFRKWSALEPDNIEALKHYADAIMRLQEYAKATVLYENILKKKPGEVDVYLQLAICQAKQTQVDKAVETLTQALALVGAPQVAPWLQDEGFSGVRGHSLFVTFARNIARRPVMGNQPAQADETAIDMKSVFDAKRLQKAQQMLTPQK
jgi:tetratricopeptide (TPR) repeat protein